MEVQDFVKGRAGTVVSRGEANPILTNRQYDTPIHPLFWRHFINPALTHEWFKHKVETSKFEKSHFGVTTETEEIRIYDDNIRLSYIYRQPLEELQMATIGYLSEWSGVPKECFDQDASWNMLKYTDGHFAWHKDKVRFKEGYEHMGTQIVFPPLEYSRFEEGSLTIFETDGRVLKFRPEENVWFYIIIPLGFAHTVEKVIGTRFSLTKEVYILKGTKLPNEPKPQE